MFAGPNGSGKTSLVHKLARAFSAEGLSSFTSSSVPTTCSTEGYSGAPGAREQDGFFWTGSQDWQDEMLPDSVSKRRFPGPPS
jgi:hypothetical protein